MRIGPGYRDAWLFLVAEVTPAQPPRRRGGYYPSHRGRPHVRQVHVLQARSRVAQAQHRGAGRRQGRVPGGLRGLGRGSLAARVFDGRHPGRRGPGAGQPESHPRGHPHLPRRARAERPRALGDDAVQLPGDDQALAVLGLRVRPEICTSDRKYLFVYPFDKKREWYGLSLEERQRIMANHIEVGRRYPEISINTAYSFGLDDQEFVVSFEGDD